jgi:beta-N-acetylhexosaminidase
VAGAASAGEALEKDATLESDGETAVDAQTVLRAFDIGPRAEAWRRAAAGGYVVYRMESEVNVAVGAAPWGPFAEVVGDPASLASARFAANPVVTCLAQAPQDVGRPDAPVLVIGRDNHRHAFVRQTVDALRATRDDVLVVDMGWPSDDRAYADVATFGASRLVGRAVLQWLAGAAS